MSMQASSGLEPGGEILLKVVFVNVHYSNLVVSNFVAVRPLGPHNQDFTVKIA